MNRILLIFSLLILTISAFAQTGCTDPQANNYDANALENDGSCTYNATTYTPSLKTTLANELEELSGMFAYNGRMFGLADSGNPHRLYEFDTIDGSIIRSYKLTGTDNVDWESITIDDNYVYVGDTGNNKQGNRTDLVIYKFPIEDLDSDDDIPSDHITPLHYHYDDQIDYTALPKNQTFFDCEAMIPRGDSLLLFMKDWKYFTTRYYTIPKEAEGDFAAKSHGLLSVTGLVTGGTYMGDSLIVLVGSSIYGGHFLEFLYDFPNDDLFGGNKRQISMTQEGLVQPESIYLKADFSGFIGTEAKESQDIEYDQAIFSFSIKEWLQNDFVGVKEIASKALDIFPNPLQSRSFQLSLPASIQGESVTVSWFDGTGRLLSTDTKHPDTKKALWSMEIPQDAPSGNLFLLLQTKKEQYFGRLSWMN